MLLRIKVKSGVDKAVIQSWHGKKNALLTLKIS